MVLVKIGAILTFLVVGGMLVNQRTGRHSLPPASPESLPAAPSCSLPTSASIRYLPRRRSAQSATGFAFGIIASLMICTILYVGVAVVLLGMMKYTTFVSGASRRSAGSLRVEVVGRASGSSVR